MLEPRLHPPDSPNQSRSDDVFRILVYKHWKHIKFPAERYKCISTNGKAGFYWAFRVLPLQNGSHSDFPVNPTLLLLPKLEAIEQNHSDWSMSAPGGSLFPSSSFSTPSRRGRDLAYKNYLTHSNPGWTEETYSLYFWCDPLQRLMRNKPTKTVVVWTHLPLPFFQKEVFPEQIRTNWKNLVNLQALHFFKKRSSPAGSSQHPKTFSIVTPLMK